MRLFLILSVMAVAALLWWHFSTPKTLSDQEFAEVYSDPLPKQRPKSVYHLGHSLVGRDMPAMLAHGVTTPDQRIERFTIQSLAEHLKDVESLTPALIFYGPLAGDMP